MNMKLYLKSRRNVLSILLVSLFAVALTVGGGGFLAQGAESNPQSSTSTQTTNTETGLVGFSGEYALKDDDSLISVIVFFENEPAAVQIYEAENEGRTLSKRSAENAVENDHSLFIQELDSLFSGPRIGRSTSSYEILWEYRLALNGVNILLPSNKVEAVADFESVRVIHPDYELEIEPLPKPEPIEASSIEALSSDRNPVGMAPGRATTRADEMHTKGYRGQGVLVAMLDTGIYYNHPAFEGAFLTIEEMRARGATHLTNADGINIDGTYYYIGVNFFSGNGENPFNDPNEVAPGPVLDTWPVRDSGTNHGTHVAGTIVARDTGGSISSLGIAPEAQIVTYRILEGISGATTTAGTIAVIERAILDGADIINMSFGAGNSAFFTLINRTINNLSKTHPNLVFVAGAGNAADGHFNVITPATTTKAISVASVHVGVATPGFGIAGFHPNPRDWSMSTWSSRGPVNTSFEIKPDIAAHGQTVLSTVPPWTSNAIGYSGMSGTSMATPHVVGAVALLIDYSRQNSEQWTAEEIKTRLMNNAYSFGENSSQNIGVFHTGAGYTDIYAAAKADMRVSVTFDRALYGETIEFVPENLTYAKTGSFSFGGVGTLGQTNTLSLLSAPSPNVRTLPATITNSSNETRTFTIDYEFTNNPNDAMSLTFSQRSIGVDPNQAATFSVTTTVRGEVAASFYQGHIFVREGENVVARLPFALVNQNAVQVPAHKLSFNLNESQASIDSINILEGTSILDFLNTYHEGFSKTEPTKEDHNFAGWYLDANFSESLSKDTVMPAEDVTLYAKWDRHEIQIAAGNDHSLAILPDGTLWTWGMNSSGQLGLGDTNNRLVPTQVSDEGVSGDRWTYVSAGNSHSLALRDDGTLWAWGTGDNGRLGNGNVQSRLIPTLVSTNNISGNRWTTIASGFNYSLAIRDDGTLWTWGAGTMGQLGHGVVAQRLSPTLVSTDNIAGDGWVTVKAGSHHTLALRDNNTLWAWGAGNGGRLGLGDAADRISPVKVSNVR